MAAAMRGHKQRVIGVEFASGSERGVSLGSDHALIVWDLRTAEPLKIVKVRQADDKLCTGLAVDGAATIALIGHNKHVSLWDLHTGTRLHWLPFLWVDAVALADDGSLAVTGSFSRDNPVVHVWDTASGKVVHRLDAGPLRAVCLSADGRVCQTVSADGILTRWNTITGRSTCVGSKAKNTKTNDNNTADNNNNASATTNNTNVNVDRSSITHLAVSVDASIGISASSACPLHAVIIWDLSTFTVDFTCTVHKGPILAVALSANGLIGASGGKDRLVVTWDTKTGHTMQVLQGHTQRVTTLSISGDNRFCLSGSHDCTTLLWRLPDTANRASSSFNPDLSSCQDSSSSSQDSGLSSHGSSSSGLLPNSCERANPAKQGHQQGVTRVACNATCTRAVSGSRSDGVRMLWRLGQSNDAEDSGDEDDPYRNGVRDDTSTRATLGTVVEVIHQENWARRLAKYHFNGRHELLGTRTIHTDRRNELTLHPTDATEGAVFFPDSHRMLDAAVDRSCKRAIVGFSCGSVALVRVVETQDSAQCSTKEPIRSFQDLRRTSVRPSALRKGPRPEPLALVETCASCACEASLADIKRALSESGKVFNAFKVTCLGCGHPASLHPAGS